jgi:hypothetical protein
VRDDHPYQSEEPNPQGLAKSPRDATTNRVTLFIEVRLGASKELVMADAASLTPADAYLLDCLRTPCGRASVKVLVEGVTR